MDCFKDAIGKKRCYFALNFLAFFLLFAVIKTIGQMPYSSTVSTEPDQSNTEVQADENNGDKSIFRVEKVRVGEDADLITIFARSRNIKLEEKEIPLVSVLRDTLGDTDPENDHLRYVWMLTYTRPSRGQKVAALVPFLYTRTTNKKNPGNDPPPAILDLASPGNRSWNKAFSFVFRKLILSEFGVGVRSSVLQYRQNKADYRRTAIARALAVLSLYQEQAIQPERLLSDADLKDMQARLSLTNKFLGGHMQGEYLTRVFEKELAKSRDLRNQNWELLRQYSEAQGLYFDPLEMADGSARHALVWIAASDIEANKDRKFESRFLNIKNPWTDTSLQKWKGYSQVRWYDADNRQVAPETPGATPRTLIPLALYGLDFPRIPTLLVDFRNNGNVKGREMSKRILHDITSNVLSLGQFSGLPYFLGRFSYDYITGKRGMDINQASRLRSYSQLKLLLAVDTELDLALRNEIADRLEHATLNPLENDLDVEGKIAQQQYKNLLAYAKRPDGLAAQLDKDRREEMVKLVHNGREQLLYSAAHFFSFGLYTKRERSTPELMARLDIRRQLDFHERYLREVVANSARPEIDSDMNAVRRSLQFVAENGAEAKGKTTKALAKIFSITDDENVRQLCLTGLYRINNTEAKKQLLAIYSNSNVTDEWRNMCARYLKLALDEGQQISAHDARAIDEISAN